VIGSAGPLLQWGGVVTISRAGRAACEYFGLYLGLLYFGVSCGVYSVLASLLYPMLPPRFRARFGRRGIGFVFRSFLALMRASGLMKLDLSALEALRGQPGLVIAPNHPCLLDAVFVGRLSPTLCCLPPPRPGPVT
jgi:hypothetical protein